MTSSQTAEKQAPGLDLDRLKGLVADVLTAAKQHGATAAEVAVNTSVGLTASVRMGEVDTLEHIRDRGLALTVYRGKRRGSASTNDFRWQAVRETVAAACAIAQFTSEDPDAGLADAELMPTTIPDLDLRHPWKLETAQAIELALRVEDAARGLDARISNSEGAAVGHADSQHVYGNTHGFIGSYARTRHSLSCAVIAEDGGGMQRDHWYTVARDPSLLEPPEDVGKRAAERALRRLSAQRLSTRQVPAIFAAEIATGLFGQFVNAIRGANLYRRSSFLWNHLGKRVFPEFIRIHEQPHLMKGLGSTPFDDEGVATHSRDIVADGVLQGYVLSSYSARKLGMQTTGNAGGVHNLIVDPGPKQLAEVLRDMDTGLLVTELMGMGVNLVTGDYSRGAAGFWVSGGEIQFPVQEITIAGNLRDMFQGIRTVASDVDTRSNIRTGSVLMERMTVAGE